MLSEIGAPENLTERIKRTTRLTPKTWVLLVVLCLLIAFPWLISNQYHVRVAVTIMIWVPLAMSFRLMTTAGEFNMAILAFMAIGAYTTALLTTDGNLNWWPAMILGGVIASLVALVVGRIVLRVKGAYFAILTFGAVMVIRFVWLTWPGFFGGTSGIANIPTVDGLSGSLDSFYLLGLGLALLFLLFLYRLEKSRYGIMMKAIGQADELAESVGVNLMNYKLAAFCVTAFISAVMGGLFASLQHFIDPEEFSFIGTLYVVVYAVAGGLRRFWGPVVGVAALFSLPVLLKEIPGYDPKIEPIIFGGILLAVMIFMPDGLVSLPKRLWLLGNWLRQKMSRREIAEYTAS